jgi:hypothetical protein
VLLGWVETLLTNPKVLLRSAVTDGVGLRYPCCNVHDCHEYLPTSKARFCLSHATLEKKCATVGCQNNASLGFKSCEETVCRNLELEYRRPEKAMFQLKERLAYHRRRIVDKDESFLADPLLGAAMATLDEDVQEDNEVDIEAEVETSGDHETSSKATCKKKNENQHKKVKATFGRKRTHNEELVVMSCGIIVGRASFYGSEAANGVLVSLLFIILLYTDYNARHSGVTSSLHPSPFQHSCGMTTIAT